MKESTDDGRGNLLSTCGFAATPAVGQVDETALVAALAPLQADIRNRLTRFAYDALGRLRFTVDGLGSVSERRYDAVGNLTDTERYAVRPSLAPQDRKSVA